MTEHHSHKHSSTFECIDDKPEYIEGQAGNSEGALFYFIRPDCGTGVPCPPYDSSRELTCVVCSR